MKRFVFNSSFMMPAFIDVFPAFGGFILFFRFFVGFIGFSAIIQSPWFSGFPLFLHKILLYYIGYSSFRRRIGVLDWKCFLMEIFIWKFWFEIMAWLWGIFEEKSGFFMDLRFLKEEWWWTDNPGNFDAMISWNVKYAPL